jgi:CRISPR-associated protein Csm3
MSKLNKKIFITADLTLVTGLHIGDSKDTVEIGGVDSPVVRRKDNYEPYIPGSSLKGKMRCLLEQLKGENADSRAKQNNGIICQLFGASDGDNKPGNPSRIIVRDAYMSRESAEELKKSDYTDLPYTEIKYENVINRIKGTAEHPRQQERVPAGTVFELNYVINVFEGDNERDLLNLFEKGLELLQDDYLGGSGSRGYGQVSISDLKVSEKTASDYLKA